MQLSDSLFPIQCVSSTLADSSQKKAIFSISGNHVSLWFYVMNSHFCLIRVTSAISREITLKSTKFSLKIKKWVKIVIHGFHISRKSSEVKSCSLWIHENFANNFSLDVLTIQKCQLETLKQSISVLVKGQDVGSSEML